jgi:hypothetical protein
MDPLALIQIIGQAVAIGKLTIDEIRALAPPGLSEAELNAILDAVVADAEARKARADDEATREG